MPAARALVVASLAAATLVGAGGVGWQAMDVSMPTYHPTPTLSSALPDVPPNAQAISQSKACGSGGCWQELRLRPRPGIRPAKVVKALDLETERCRENGWPDPRSTCVGAYLFTDGVVVVYASYAW